MKHSNFFESSWKLVSIIHLNGYVDPPFGCYFMQLILATCHSRISQYRIKIVELMDQLGEDTCKGEEDSRRRICRPLSWGADEREWGRRQSSGAGGGVVWQLQVFTFGEAVRDLFGAGAFVWLLLGRERDPRAIGGREKVRGEFISFEEERRRDWGGEFGETFWRSKLERSREL